MILQIKYSYDIEVILHLPDSCSFGFIEIKGASVTSVAQAISPRCLDEGDY
jgi:hypothetical protein